MTRTQITTRSLQDNSVTPEKMVDPFTFRGAISATEYLGITIPSGEYLPLSGGTLTGPLSVQGDTTWYDLSAEVYIPSTDSYETQVYPETKISDVLGVVTEIENELIYIDSQLNLDAITTRGNTTTNSISVSSLSASSILLTPLAASPTYKEGSIYYDQGTHTLAYMNDNPDVRVNIGEESLIRCRNASGVLIPNGQAVKIIGAQGNRPRIIKATAEAHPFDTHTNEIIGVATHDISHTEDGYVTTEGIVRGVDLSLFSEGDELYLQIDGTLNTTYPPAPYDKILVGYVTVATNNGQMFVSPVPPLHINDISGLSATAPANGDIFSYNSTLSTFVNTPLSAIGLGTISSQNYNNVNITGGSISTSSLSSSNTTLTGALSVDVLTTDATTKTNLRNAAGLGTADTLIMGGVVATITAGFRARADNSRITIGASDDTVLMRASAGVWEINNGTAGQFRDLKLRNLIATGGITLSGTQTINSGSTWSYADQPAKDAHLDALGAGATGKTVLASTTPAAAATAIGLGTGNNVTFANLSATGLTLAYTSKTTNYTATVNDYTIHALSAITITLPSAVGIAGKLYNIKNGSTSAITVSAFQTQLIDGANTATLNIQYESTPIQSTGTGWIIL